MDLGGCQSSSACMCTVDVDHQDYNFEGKSFSLFLQNLQVWENLGLKLGVLKKAHSAAIFSWHH